MRLGSTFSKISVVLSLDVNTTIGTQHLATPGSEEISGCLRVHLSVTRSVCKPLGRFWCARETALLPPGPCTLFAGPVDSHRLVQLRRTIVPISSSVRGCRHARVKEFHDQLEVVARRVQLRSSHPRQGSHNNGQSYAIRPPVHAAAHYMSFATMADKTLDARNEESPRSVVVTRIWITHP